MDTWTYGRTDAEIGKPGTMFVLSIQSILILKIKKVIPFQPEK